MFEVYTGTKAGRPTVLLLLSAGILVTALGLAWIQVRGTRALGDEVRIEGTPLVVRPPKGWARHPDRPGMFVKTVRSETHGRKREVIERKIEFDYRRWKVFQPLVELIRLSNRQDYKQAYGLEPAQIGGLDGAQVRRAHVFRWRGRQETGESIYRLVSTARGDQISVEYTPLGELSGGDMELFDAVCQAVTLDDPSVHAKPDEVLAHAGVRFSISENWTVLGPDYPEILGLYVQSSEGGIPVWGLGLFRTWLAAGRRPADLLRSFAELRWPPELAAAVEPQERRRADGAIIATIQRPGFERADGDVASAWVVAKSPTKAAVIFALAGQRAAPAAHQAAAKLAEQIEFTANYPVDGVKAAEANGRKLAALFGRKGVARWWGAGEAASYYFGQVLGQPRLVISQREAIGGDPARGYEGFDRYVHPDPADDKRRPWTIDRRADAYTYSEVSDSVGRGRAGSVRLREFREAGESTIRRTVTVGPRTRRFEVPVGAAFVPPPVDTLAQGWVAQQEAGAWLIEVSPLDGSTTITQLLTPLGPDQEGRPRVLLVEDYSPRGMILTFDADLEMVSLTAPIARYDRVTREQAEEILRALGR